MIFRIRSICSGNMMILSEGKRQIAITTAHDAESCADLSMPGAGWSREQDLATFAVNHPMTCLSKDRFQLLIRSAVWDVFHHLFLGRFEDSIDINWILARHLPNVNNPVASAN